MHYNKDERAMESAAIKEKISIQSLRETENLLKKRAGLNRDLAGGWRQAGVIAAPGIGLKKMVNRLPEDHQNAENMRKGLEG